MELLTKTGLADRRHHRPVRALRAASSSASRSRARSSRGRRSCSPTSRPATSTRRPAARSSTCCASRRTTYGQTIVMVTHEAAAAAIADRILFLADGLIVKELTEHEPGRGARGDEHPAVVIGVALNGLARPQAARGADRDRDRARRRDDQRHLRADRHDQVGVRDRLHAGLQEHRRGRSPARARSAGNAEQRPVAARRCPSRCSRRVRALPEVAQADGRHLRTGAARRPQRQGRSRAAARRTWPSAVRPRASASTRSC